MQPLKSLPGSDVILDYLSKDCQTEEIDIGTLQKIARTVENCPFNRGDIERSIKELNLSISGLKIMDLGYVLNRCVQGIPPSISRNKSIPKSMIDFSSQSTSHISSVHRVSSTERDKEEYILQALKEAGGENPGGCLTIVRSIKSYEIRNKVCLAVARFFAQKGDLVSAKSIISEISAESELQALRERNKAFAELALVFAALEKIYEAKDCIRAIADDYCKCDNSESFNELSASTYTRLVEELIRQKKFEEANELLSDVEREDRARLENQIKKHLLPKP